MNFHITAATIGKWSVKNLVESIADVNDTGVMGETLLMAAIIRNDMESFNTLLTRPELNVDLADSSGNTAMHLAAKQGNVYAVEKLFERGAAVDVENKVHQTPKSLAVREKHVDVVKALHRMAPDVPMEECVPLYGRDFSEKEKEKGANPVMRTMAQLISSNGEPLPSYIRMRWNIALENC